MVKAIFTNSYVNGIVLTIQDYSEDNILSRIVELLNDAVPTVNTNTNSSNEVDKVIGELDTTKLELRCSNAYPNYGKLWFHSRSRPSGTAIKVLERSKQIIWNELRGYSFICVLATMRQAAIKYNKKSNVNLNITSLTDLLTGRTRKVDHFLNITSMADHAGAHICGGFQTVRIGRDCRIGEKTISHSNSPSVVSNVI